MTLFRAPLRRPPGLSRLPRFRLPGGPVGDRRHPAPAATTAPAITADAPDGGDERRFAAGTRSLADLIAPGAVEVARDHLRLDREYARVLAVTGFPRTVCPGWLGPLTEAGEPLELSLHVRPLDGSRMVAALTRQMTRLHSSRLLDDRSGRLADPEREVAFEDAERLRDALQRGDERVFSVSLSLLLRGGSPAELDARTRRAEAALGGLLAQSRVALLEQDRAFRSCLPEGRDALGVCRNLDTGSLAATLPFAPGSLLMPGGVLYGVARHSRSPVVVDPFDPVLENANAAVFAVAGAGKSYFTKLLALRTLLTGVDFLVIDPEDEYRRVCAAVGGQRVRVASTSDQRLNPFDLPPPPQGVQSPSPPAGAAAEPENAGDGPDPLAERVAALVGLLEVMLADPSPGGPGGPGAQGAPGRTLTAQERAVLDRALYETYAAAGITADPATHGRPAPLLRDLHAVLVAAPDGAAAGLAARLRRYVDGSLAGLFAGPTSVALDRPFVVFDVQGLEPELRPVGIHLITSFVWNQVRRARRPRLLVVDEAWSLLQYPEGGAFLAGLARRARKYYLGLVTISQSVPDFLDCAAGQAVLANAAVKLLLRQDSTAIERVAAAFRLSEEEARFLLAAAKGEGLLCLRGGRIALQVTASPLEHRLATTAPRELFGLPGRHGGDAPAPGSPTAARRRRLVPLPEARPPEAGAPDTRPPPAGPAGDAPWGARAGDGREGPR
jgi:hypothetical protein